MNDNFAATTSRYGTEAALLSGEVLSRSAVSSNNKISGLQEQARLVCALSPPEVVKTVAERSDQLWRSATLRNHGF